MANTMAEKTADKRAYMVRLNMHQQAYLEMLMSQLNFKTASKTFIHIMLGYGYLREDLLKAQERNQALQIENQALRGIVENLKTSCKLVTDDLAREDFLARIDEAASKGTGFKMGDR